MTIAHLYGHVTIENKAVVLKSFSVSHESPDKQDPEQTFVLLLRVQDTSYVRAFHKMRTRVESLAAYSAYWRAIHECIQDQAIPVVNAHGHVLKSK